MNELINPDAGSTRTAARTASVDSQFRNERDFESKVLDSIAKLSPIEAAIDDAQRNPNSGLLFDGGATAAGSRLIAEALSPADLQAVTAKTIGHTRTHIGSDAAGVIAGAVPSCGQRI